VHNEALPVKRRSGLGNAPGKVDYPLKKEALFGAGPYDRKMLYLVEITIAGGGPDRMTKGNAPVRMMKGVGGLGSISEGIHAGLRGQQGLAALLTTGKASDERTVRDRPEENLPVTTRRDQITAIR
jgi:hypothetical protein